MMRQLLLIAMLCGVLVPACAGAADNDDLRLIVALEKTVKDVVKRVEPSIACILVSRSEEYRKRYKDAPPSQSPWQLGDFQHKDSRLDLANSANVPESFGSGVVVSAERRLVLTNYHVIREATKVYVRLPGGGGSYANIHAADWRSDLAVLKLIDPIPLQEIAFGDGGKVQKGQIVLALANPHAAGFRDSSPNASWGLVTNLRRPLPSPRENETPLPPGRRPAWANLPEILDQQNKLLHHFGTLIQTDAKLSLGSSGGALLNLKGEMIGLVSALAAIHGSEAPGSFAVPIDDAIKRIIDKLMHGREVEYGFLGVKPSDPTGAGVCISEITSGSPAERAGLHARDDLVSIGGQRVTARDDLFLFVSTQLAGNTVRIEVRRDGRVQSLSATLVKYYVPIEKSLFSEQPPLCRGLRVDYASLIPQRAWVNQGIPPGVVIRQVQPNSPADRALLQVDKVITEVKRQPVNTPAEFYAEMRKHSGPVEVRLLDPDKYIILEAR